MFWEQGAEVVNAKIAELLNEIKGENERQERSEDKSAPSIPQELPGPHIEFTDGQFELVEIKTDSQTDFDHETQETLRQRLQENVSNLLENTASISNQYPGLKIVLEEYKAQLDKDLEDLNSAEFWTYNAAVMAQAKAFLSQNVNQTLTPALEPSLAAKLEEIAQLNGGFILGFPKGKQLSDRANEAHLPPEAERQQQILEIIALLKEHKEIIGEKLSHLLMVTEEATITGSWASARFAYSTTATIHNLLLAFGKQVLKVAKTNPKNR